MMVSRSLTVLVLLCTALRHVACPRAHADEQTPTPEQLVYFQKQVRRMNFPSAISLGILYANMGAGVQFGKLKSEVQ